MHCIGVMSAISADERKWKRHSKPSEYAEKCKDMRVGAYPPEEIVSESHEVKNDTQ